MTTRVKKLKRLRLVLAQWLLWKTFLWSETPEYYWRENLGLHKMYLAHASYIILMFDTIKVGFFSKKQGKLIRLKKVLRKLN